MFGSVFRSLVLVSLILATAIAWIVPKVEKEFVLQPGDGVMERSWPKEWKRKELGSGGFLLINSSDRFHETLFICHGNGGSIESLRPLAEGLSNVFNVVLLEYAGFGSAIPRHKTKTPWRPDPNTLVRDLREAWAVLPCAPQDIRLMGFSIGGGCVSQFLKQCSRHAMPKQVILFNSFASLPKVVEDQLPSLIGRFFTSFMVYRWNSLEGLQRYLDDKKDGEVILICTADDQLITPSHTLELESNLQSKRVRRLVLKNGGHNASIGQHVDEWVRFVLVNQKHENMT